MALPLHLRDVVDGDVLIFFEHLQDEESIHMAAFTHEDPSDYEAHLAHWQKIRNDDTVLIRTLVEEDRVVGHVASFVMAGQRDVTYWIGREHWGHGYATQGLDQFLGIDPVRPLHGRAAKASKDSVATA